MSRGPSRERAVKRLLELDGWLVVKAGGSLGSADLLACRAVGKSFRSPPTPLPHTEVLLVQVKGTAAKTANGAKLGPFNKFGPADRAQLLSDAEKAGGRAVLCWWPPYRDPEWIYEDAWPEARKEAA